VPNSGSSRASSGLLPPGSRLATPARPTGPSG
jgi:hypothetical protein